MMGMFGYIFSIGCILDRRILDFFKAN